MDVIFLDIDGVLNVSYPEHDKFGRVFHPKFVKNLKSIINATSAKIVISSSWRASGFEVMKDMWKERHLPGEVIDITPYYCKSLMNYFDVQNYDDLVRGHEIQWWLDSQSPSISKYVILDDDEDMLDNQKKNFIQTSGNTDHTDYEDIGYGLTVECAEAAIKILNSLE